MTGQHALFIGYPIIEIVQPSVKKQGPIYAPLFLIPVKEDGLGTKNQDLIIEPFINGTNGADRAEIRPNIILKQWLLSKYDKNIQFNIEYASEILQHGDQSIENDFENSLVECFSDWKNIDNRKICITGLTNACIANKSTSQFDLFEGARLVNSAILGVADFKGQSLVANIEQTIVTARNTDAPLGIMDSFLEPIHQTTIKPIIEPSEQSKFLVCDSDPSQEKVIWKVRDSDLTVIQGPPGTGKSQTIVNMISDALAKKQKVAVFSQKRAALDVIHKRAKRDGFGELCLLLEDAHKQRVDIINNIKQAKNPQGSSHSIEINRNKVATELVGTENLIDNLSWPYKKQEWSPSRSPTYPARLRSLNIKDYTDTHFWGQLIQQVSKNNYDMYEEKDNVEVLYNALLNAGYAQSIWRHYRLDRLNSYDFEDATQYLRDILTFYDQGVFTPKNVAKREKWLLLSPYFDTHCQAFGIKNIGISHNRLAEAVTYLNDNLDHHDYRYEDIISGEAD